MGHPVNIFKEDGRMEDGNSTIKFYTNPGNATKVEGSI